MGRFIGKMLGKYLNPLNHEPIEYDNIKNFKENFKYITTNYGEAIPSRLTLCYSKYAQNPYDKAMFSQ